MSQNKKPLGIDEYKYKKIYEKRGFLTKAGIGTEKFGINDQIDLKWEKYGRGYFNEYPGRDHIDQMLILRGLRSITSILDVGCGYNEFLKLLPMINPIFGGDKLVGVDIACPGADIIAAAHNMPTIRNNSFDLITSLDCMEHIPEEEVDLALDEFKRVGKRIYLEISLNHSYTKIDGEPVHVCVKPAEWWMKKIRDRFLYYNIICQTEKGHSKKIVVYGSKDYEPCLSYVWSGISKPPPCPILDLMNQLVQYHHSSTKNEENLSATISSS